MTFLLNRISPLAWAVAGSVLVATALHLYRQDGYDEGFNHARASGDQALAELRETHSLIELDNALQAAEQMRREQARNNQLSEQLATHRAELRQTTDRLNKEITHVTTLYRRTLDTPSEPLPVAVFTAGFVRVWDSANGIVSLPIQPAASGTTAPPNGTGTLDELDTGLAQDSLLGNHIRNAERHSLCRAQLNRLIDWNTHE